MDRDKAIDEIVERFMAQIGEYADAIQISIGYLDENGNTIVVHKGDGLWHARHGMATEFLEQDVARNHFYVRSSEFEDEEEF